MHSKMLIFLACLMFSGCKDYYAEYVKQSSEQLANDLRAIDEKRKQEDIEYYAPMVYKAEKYVEEYSTEEMKDIISRGELLIGMNQHEVMASISATNFQYGVPIRMNRYTSAYGDFETWEVGNVVSVYLLDFTNGILTGIYEP